MSQMLFVLVKDTILINEEHPLLNKWVDPDNQIMELTYKLFSEGWHIYLPLGTVILYYIFWKNEVLGDRLPVTLKDMYNDITSYDGFRRKYPSFNEFHSYAGRHVKWLASIGYIKPMKFNGYKAYRITEVGANTVRKTAKNAWYFLEVVRVLKERGMEKTLRKLSKVNVFETVKNFAEKVTVVKI